MESVYKLSKYSQKISEACRAKQLNKVMEYNQHELAHINKLSKYFGNQKGGDATVEQVVRAVSMLVQEVSSDKDAVMNTFLQKIDNAVEPKAFELFNDPPPLIHDEILQKVRALVNSKERITEQFKKHSEQETILKGEMQIIYTTIYTANGGQRGEQQNVTKDLILKQFNEFKAQAQAAAQARAQEEVIHLKKRLDEIAATAKADTEALTQTTTQNQQLLVQELSRVKAEANSLSEANTRAQARINELEEAQAQSDVQKDMTLARYNALKLNLQETIPEIKFLKDAASKSELLVVEIQTSLNAKDEELKKVQQTLADNLAQLQAQALQAQALQARGGSKRRP